MVLFLNSVPAFPYFGIEIWSCYIDLPLICCCAVCVCVYPITVLFSIAFLAYQEFGFSVQQWALCIRRMPFCSSMSTQLTTSDSGGDFHSLTLSIRKEPCLVLSCLILLYGFVFCLSCCVVVWWCVLRCVSVVSYCVIVSCRVVMCCVFVSCSALSCPSVFIPLHNGDREFLFSTAWWRKGPYLVLSCLILLCCVVFVVLCCRVVVCLRCVCVVSCRLVFSCLVVPCLVQAFLFHCMMVTESSSIQR